MTLNDLIPATLRGNGIRRAVDKVAELRDENVRLLNRQAAADDYFALLIQDRDQVYAAWRFAQKGRQAGATTTHRRGVEQPFPQGRSTAAEAASSTPPPLGLAAEALPTRKQET